MPTNDRTPWLLDSEHALPIEAIATAMSHINRFCGRTPRPYSVAKHSLIVMHLLPPDATHTAQKLALLHDAHEVYSADLPRSIELRLGDAWQQITDELDYVLFARYRVDPSQQDQQYVDVADHLANEIEIATLGLSHSMYVDDALNVFTCEALTIQRRRRHIISSLSRNTTPEFDTNSWLWWWRELKCAAAMHRIAEGQKDVSGS